MKHRRLTKRFDCGSTRTAPATPPALARSTILAVLLVLSRILHRPVRGADSSSTKESPAVPDTVALQMEADSIEKAFTNTFGKFDKHRENKSSASSEVMWLVVGGGLLGLVVLVRYI